MRPNYGDFLSVKEKKERKGRKIVFGILAALLFAVVLVIVLFGKKDFVQSTDVVADTEDTEQIYYTKEEVDTFVAEAAEEGKTAGLDEIKNYLADGKSAVEAFRAVYTDNLVVAADGKYHFIPIRDDLKKNNYSEEYLQVKESGEFQYVKEEQLISYKGIDVSRFQGNIDWNAVAADGVEFAFIRVGNRGYGTGAIVDDAKFEENIKNARKAGIKVGVYFFSQAVTEEEALEEVNYVLEKIAPYKVECPVVVDLEMIAGDEGRADALTVEERTHIMKVFCDAVAEAGYQPMIYMNLEMAALRVNLEELEEYDKWFAYYNPDFYFPYAYKVWQYSEKGTVAGISGAVDLNISFEPLWE